MFMHKKNVLSKTSGKKIKAIKTKIKTSTAMKISLHRLPLGIHRAVVVVHHGKQAVRASNCSYVSLMTENNDFTEILAPSPHYSS